MMCIFLSRHIELFNFMKLAIMDIEKMRKVLCTEHDFTYKALEPFRLRPAFSFPFIAHSKKNISFKKTKTKTPFMRTLLLAAVAILTACNQKTTSSNHLTSDVARNNLKGRVKQVTSQMFLIDSATGKQGQLDQKVEEKYDDAGFETIVTQGDGKDSLVTRTDIRHDPMGHFKEIKTTVNGKTKSSLTFDWDGNGNCKMVKSFDSTGKQDGYYINNVFNKFGEVTSSSKFKMDKKPMMSFGNEYDSIYGIGGYLKDSTGNITSSNKTTLNDKKDPVRNEETMTDKGGKKNTVTTYTYDGWDKQGNWTEQTTYNDNGKKIKVTKRVIEYFQ